MSETPKFTPGPWVVVTNANDIPCIVQVAEHRVASTYFNGRDDGAPPDKATAEANAALIAAAPDLYEALQFIFEHIADPERGPRDLYPAFGLNSSRALELACAALAKANPV